MFYTFIEDDLYLSHPTNQAVIIWGKRKYLISILVRRKWLNSNGKTIVLCPCQNLVNIKPFRAVPFQEIHSGSVIADNPGNEQSEIFILGGYKFNMTSIT